MKANFPNFNNLIPDKLTHFSVVDLAATDRFDSLPFDVGKPALLLNVSQEQLWRLIKIGRDFVSTIIHVRTKQGKVFEIPLSEAVDLDAEAIFLPALKPNGSMDNFRNVIARLRAPEDGCPWDTKQTISSLRKNLLEECYEALDVIDSGNYGNLAEELGDLFMIVVMIAQIGEEDGSFDFATIVQKITEKMIRRHPHIFGDVEVSGVEEVFANWDQIKKQERAASAESEKGILDSVPKSAPALSQGQQLQDRAARVGFDWPALDDVLDKIVEEVKELRNAKSADELEAELGDLFFVLVNYTRWKKIDSETALQRTNQKFRRRFSYIEKQVAAENQELTDKTLEELDAYWNEAKKLERGL